MSAPAELNRAEALAVLAHNQADADLLTVVPWSERDSITLGEVLRWRIVLALPMLSFEEANAIAMQAVQDVDPADAAYRILMVAWSCGQSHSAWLRGPIVTEDIRRPFMLIPVAELLSDLASRLADHRRQSAHLN
jgi:hypothetical protein